MSRMRLAIPLILCFVLTLVVGCGPPPHAKVSGQVTFAGKPLPGGLVTFRPANPAENSVACELDRNGHFEVMLPVGEVTVSLDNREFAPQIRKPLELPDNAPPELRRAVSTPPSAAPNPHADRYVAIPERYHAVETSGLAFTVVKGDQVHDLALTK